MQMVQVTMSLMTLVRMTTNDMFLSCFIAPMILYSRLCELVVPVGWLVHALRLETMFVS